jgi:hypothetical protein
VVSNAREFEDEAQCAGTPFLGFRNGSFILCMSIMVISFAGRENRGDANVDPSSGVEGLWGD